MLFKMLFPEIRNVWEACERLCKKDMHGLEITIANF